MYKITTILAACAMFALTAAPALAQDTSPECQRVQDRLNAGDDSLTSRELLDCGLSPEAINPCEGSTDPNCNDGGNYPSINSPENDPYCRNHPEQCVIRGDTLQVPAQGFGEGTASPTASASPSAAAADQYGAAGGQYVEPEPAATVPEDTLVLPATGGPQLLSLGAGALLLAAGAIAARYLARS